MIAHHEQLLLRTQRLSKTRALVNHRREKREGWCYQKKIQSDFTVGFYFSPPKVNNSHIKFVTEVFLPSLLQAFFPTGGGGIYPNSSKALSAHNQPFWSLP